jgi:hypothetical protein
LAVKKQVLILQGLVADTLFLHYIYNWSIHMHPKTWRFPISLVLAYLLRGISMALFQMRMPNDSLW